MFRDLGAWDSGLLSLLMLPGALGKDVQQNP